jgi:hypothetical protein
MQNFVPSFQTNLIEAPPGSVYRGSTGKSDKQPAAAGRGWLYVAALLSGNGVEDAATCANRAGARHTLGARSRARRGESNALLGWVGDPLWPLARRSGHLKTRRAGTKAGLGGVAHSKRRRWRELGSSRAFEALRGCG